MVKIFNTRTTSKEEIYNFVVKQLLMQCVAQHAEQLNIKIMSVQDWPKGRIVNYLMPEEECDPVRIMYENGEIFDYYYIDEGAAGMRVDKID